MSSFLKEIFIIVIPSDITECHLYMNAMQWLKRMLKLHTHFTTQCQGLLKCHKWKATHGNIFQVKTGVKNAWSQWYMARTMQFFCSGIFMLG